MNYLTAGILIAGLTIAIPLTAAQKPAEAPTARPPEKVYASVCGYCHGRNVGPIILGRKLPATYITLITRAGRNGMPAFRTTEISKTELDALSLWISKSKPNKQESGK